MDAPIKARVIDSFPAPTLDEIKRFEARNGVVLPEEYVEFLLASNGGLFTGEYALVGPPSDDRVDAIDLLYALNAPFDFWDLQTAARDWEADCPNGRGFLPVGRDPYGNEYCLKVSRKLFGVFGGGRKKTSVVGLRDRETGEIWKIADSFAAFLDNIYQSDGEETSPVCRIVEEGRVDELKALLAQNAVDFAETSRNGLPLLTLAACRRQPEVCRLLIEAGADVDPKNADGKPPLHFATSVDVINLLIDAGADVEARSNDGATPLEGWAKFLRQRPAIELIKRGARFDGLDAERLALNPYVARFIEGLR